MNLIILNNYYIYLNLKLKFDENLQQQQEILIFIWNFKIYVKNFNNLFY